ncbi:NADH-quinone oxidoreductase subunit I [Sanguibacter suarezii]|uniref:NADH-quinone oxidoreductase subunit I n=1 Tax=Sanguibacter suarezii TaxID=60921 RepID=UPI000AFC4051|nr:4Fe-4S dicluster domain-containing protein [Sanguibacter suarezii]
MTGSLRSVARWVARQDDGVILELVCAEHPAPALGDPARTVVRAATCLAEVPAHEILELFTAGAQTVVVRRDECAQPHTANALLDAAAQVLASTGVDRLHLSGPEQTAPEQTGERRTLLGRRRPRAPRQSRREVLDAERMPVPRRQVLGLGAGSARGLADEYAPDAQRLTTALAALLPPSASLPDLLSPAVQLRGKGCTACGVCVRACPADALTLRHLGGSGDEANAALLMTTLVQDPTRCDGCLACVQICPEDVLTAQGRWGWDAVLARVATPAPAPVASLSTAQCQRCRTRFPTTGAGTLCPVCAYRRANPFSSRLPVDIRP